MIFWVLLSFMLSLLLTYGLSRPNAPLARVLLAQPNERSLHERPTPHSGGLAVLAGLLVSASLGGWWLDAAAYPPGLGWALLLVAGVSLLDDWREVSPRYRLLVHGLAAGILLTTGLYLPQLELPGLVWAWPLWLAAPVLGIALVWLINLYNFMDGMDGFAGGMAVLGFGTLAVLGLQAAAPLFALWSLLIAAAALGFLVFNFPPAVIFMGDVGASTLGLLLGAFALWAAQIQVVPLWATLLLFSPFILDATLTLLRRLRNGEKVWQAHRKHYYQRLVRAGWGHKKTVLWEYALMAACSLSVLAVPHLSARAQAWLLLAWILIYVILIIGLERFLQRRGQPF